MCKVKLYRIIDFNFTCKKIKYIVKIDKNLLYTLYYIRSIYSRDESFYSIMSYDDGRIFESI